MTILWEYKKSSVVDDEELAWPLKPAHPQTSHQIRTRSPGSRYCFSPGFISNASYHRFRLRTASARYRFGECVSVRTCWRSAASRSFSAHDCAYARKNSWSPVNPPRSGAACPC